MPICAQLSIPFAKPLTILDNLEKARQNGVPENVISQCMGEALFVRAAQYARLVSHFGDVVYVTTSITDLDEAFKMGRTDKKIVIEGVYEDFDNRRGRVYRFGRS